MTANTAGVGHGEWASGEVVSPFVRSEHAYRHSEGETVPIGEWHGEFAAEVATFISEQMLSSEWEATGSAVTPFAHAAAAAEDRKSSPTDLWIRWSVPSSRGRADQDPDASPAAPTDRDGQRRDDWSSPAAIARWCRRLESPEDHRGEFVGDMIACTARGPSQGVRRPDAWR